MRLNSLLEKSTGCLKSVLKQNHIRVLLNVIPDRLFLKMVYRYKFKRSLNLNNPKYYTEKLQWLKLYDRKPEYTTMVDKCDAKRFVAERIGNEYIIPTLGVWDSFETIDFSTLPNQFVLKCTHDSGGIIICKDKKNFDIDSAKKKMSRLLKRNYYWQNREWPYKNIKPRIIAEKYMVDESGFELKDYKFFCFDGKPELLYVACDRGNLEEETKFNFYDMNFNFLPFRNGHPNAELGKIKCPSSFNEMKRLAAILSEGLPHLRVDFYDINGEIYFGELTFYHWSGLMPFEPDEWDLKIGELINLQ